MTRELRRLAAVLVVAVVAASACGTPSGAVQVPARDLPFGLGRSPEPSGGGPSELLSLYFVRDGSLVAVNRTITTATSPEQGVIQALLAGPTSKEDARGIVSQIPPQTKLLEVRVLDQVAEVDLSAEFQTPAPPPSILLRVAQVVWTLVALPDVTAVRFLIDGTLTSVLTDSGTSVGRPVTAPDFASVAPPGA